MHCTDLWYNNIRIEFGLVHSYIEKNSDVIELMRYNRRFLFKDIKNLQRKLGGKKMREKLREIRNKEEGFTLVELLAVIVILGIILAIAIPSIGGVINKATGDSKEAEQGLIVDAGRLYLTANGGDEVSVEKLVEEGYLEERDSKNLADYLNSDHEVVKVKDSKVIKYELHHGSEKVYPKNP